MRSRDYLAHHGVKGMKWGVRRSRKGSILGRKKSSAPSKPIPKENTFSKDYADMKNMNNKELKAAINRLQLENQYRYLTSKDVPAPARKKGKDVVKGVVKQMAKDTMNEILRDVRKDAYKYGKEFVKELWENRNND